jgi:hypothetical protein
LTTLLHDVWIDIDEDGQEIESCCLSGRQGDGLRKLLSPKARLVHKFLATSHFEAMQIYNSFLGREPYTTNKDWDYKPYPASWAE